MSRPTGDTTASRTPEPPDWPSGLRGLGLALTASDPGLGRLRSAVGSVVVLAVTAAVVLGAALLAGGPATAALTGVVLAFVTSIGLGDGASADQARTIGWTAVAVSATAAVGSLLGGATTPVGIPVFIALGVVVVFLQRLGPRGFAPGMAGFIAYLATSLTGLTPGALPLAVGCALLGAVTVLAVRWIVRPRRPDRAARAVLDALETRAAFAVLALGALLREDGSDRARRRARRSLGALRRAAAAADDRLAETDTPVLPGADNQALGVRVFDLRLGLEHLAGLLDLDRLDPGPGPSHAARRELADLFDDVGRALLAPHVRSGRFDRVDARLAAPGPEDQARVRHTLARVVEEWRRPPDRPVDEGDDDPDGDPDGHSDGGDGAGDGSRGDDDGPPMSDTVRRAVQVGVAVGAAALAGQLISSTQWFFAVVIAFTVFLASSSRGGVLREGWRRTVGTLVGVVVGVVLAAVIGGDPVLTVGLLALCLVGALYVAGVSSTALMVFVTVAIALVYGAVGRFTVDVLLIRLAETAVGAGIGIAVSFLVLPTRTRTGLTDATTRFLRAVRAVVEESAEVLTCDAEAGRATQSVDEGSAQELRDAYAQVVAAAEPLTDGPAGLFQRTVHRDALRVVESCDHHARLLLHLARRHGAVLGGDDAAAGALRDAATHVAGRLDALARRLDRRLDDDGTDVGDDSDHGRVLGALDDAARRLDADSGPGPGGWAAEEIGEHRDGDDLAPGDLLETVGDRLRAVDRALTDISRRR